MKKERKTQCRDTREKGEATTTSGGGRDVGKVREVRDIMHLGDTSTRTAWKTTYEKARETWINIYHTEWRGGVMKNLFICI